MYSECGTVGTLKGSKPETREHKESLSNENLHD